MLFRSDHGEQQGEHHLRLQRQGMAGFGTSKMAGKTTPIKRSAPSSSGGIPSSPHLMAMKLSPQQRMTRAARHLSLVCMVEIPVISSAARGWGYTARRDRQEGEHTLGQVVSVKAKDPFGFFS